MNLQKIWLITATVASLLIPGHVLAEGRTSVGYASSVTLKSLVMDGVSYRFRTNREEKEPVEVQCAVKDQKVDCEELTRISGNKSARAKISFDSAGYVIRVQILDVLK